MNGKKFIDLVIGGPDMSGTSTQVQNAIDYFQRQDMLVKDLRGTEEEVLFHAEIFKELFKNKIHCKEFLRDSSVDLQDKRCFLARVQNLMNGFDSDTNQNLQVGSMVSPTYIDPNSADVWIMEEPPNKGAGQVCRVIEQNRSKFGRSINPIAAAEAHSVYRTDEFLRFREPLRQKGKIIVRSRSEESVCYQIFDETNFPQGIDEDYYLNLAGHKIAFGNPPTHLFIVCGPANWTEKDYSKFKKEICRNRILDDYEKNVPYQILVNRRYASNWIEEFYEKAGSKVPEITRFDIHLSKHEIRKQMNIKLEDILAIRN